MKWAKKQDKRQLDYLNSQLFQEKITGNDNIEEAQNEIIDLREDIEENKQTQISIECLSNHEKIVENTDIAALIAYEKLNEYNRQLREENFVWLPSREKIDTEAMKIIESGNPKQTRKGIFFISEPGSGKTEQIKAIAKRLTGLDHVKISCGPRLGDPQLIGKERVFPGATKIEEGTFMDYRETVSGAWTGYDYSYQKESARDHSQVIELDEMPKAFDNDTFFTRMKGFFSIKDGDIMPGTDKPVLPGRIIFGSGNVGVHHGNKPVPPALEREIEVIPVDYPEMSAENPELYEFMLVALMKKGALPAVKDKELAPSYIKKELAENERIELSDKSVKIAEDELIQDTTKEEHGFLYRLAYAVRAVQNSYMARGGENPYIDYTKRELLRFRLNDKDEEYISDSNVGDVIILGSTITLNDINGWMTGYLEESQKKKAKTLTEWLQDKLEEKINAKHEDQGKLRAIFNHFHLLESVDNKGKAKILTPKEIGYLSPRVPRPVYVEKPVPTKITEEEKKEDITPQNLTEIYKTMKVTLEDGSSIIISVENYKEYPVGERMLIDGQKIALSGIIEDKQNINNGQPIGSLIDIEGLCVLIEEAKIKKGVLDYFDDLIGRKGVEDLREDLRETWKDENCEKEEGALQI